MIDLEDLEAHIAWYTQGLTNTGQILAVEHVRHAPGLEFPRP
jgi:hypothetical protein